MVIRLVPIAQAPGAPLASWSDDRPRVLGRSETCDIVVTGRGVSSVHCEIVSTRDGFLLRDLGSTNGTFLNERPVSQPTLLGDGDELALGLSVLRVELSATGAFEAPANFQVVDENGARTLLGASITLGRRPDAGLRVEDTGVSRTHATLSLGTDGFMLRDERSRNGTFVDGERIVAALLAGGERITLGNPSDEGGRTSIAVAVRGRTCSLTATRATAATLGVSATLLPPPAGAGLTLPPPRRRASAFDLEGRRGAREDTVPLARDDVNATRRDVPAVAPAARDDVNATRRDVPAVVPAARDDVNAMRRDPAREATRIVPMPDEIVPAGARKGAAATAAHERRAGASYTPPAARTRSGISNGLLRWATRSLPLTLTRALGADGAAIEERELSRVIRGLEKKKALYRGGKWVPTSDLAPSGTRRVIVLLSLLLPPLLAAAFMMVGLEGPLSPGPLSPIHSGANYHAGEIATGASGCRACHTPFQGVTDRACSSCHRAIRSPAPHDVATLGATGIGAPGCTGCHAEHRGEQRASGRNRAQDPLRERRPQPALVVAKEACARCHATAHEKPPVSRPGRGTVHLGVFFSARWVHALHPGTPGCAGCHETAEDRRSGNLSTGCAVCHGGTAKDAAGADCTSCHPFHRPKRLRVQHEPDPPPPPGFITGGV